MPLEGRAKVGFSILVAKIKLLSYNCCYEIFIFDFTIFIQN